MAKDWLVHISAVGIERNLEEYPGLAVLMDCDGEIVFTVPEDWTDHQIYKALSIANNAFRYGKEVGVIEKVQEIKEVLGVT